jgi:hypothetical protein
MLNYSNSNKNLNVPVEEYITEFIIELRQSGESLRSQYHLMKARSYRIDPHQEPKKYKVINSLARRLLELAESATECADEYELMKGKMFLDGGPEWPKLNFRLTSIPNPIFFSVNVYQGV